MDEGTYYVPCHDGTHYYVTKLPDRKQPSLVRAVRRDGEAYDTIAAPFASQEEADIFKAFLESVADMLPKYPETMLLESHLRKTQKEG